MTLIAITCQGDSAQILNDTAAYSSNLRHLTTTTKVHPITHLDAAVAFGGRADFGPWVRFAMDTDARLAHVEFDELVEALPAVLPGLFAAYLQGNQPDDPTPGVVFLVGYSTEAGEFRAFQLTSGTDFEAAPLHGTYLHPTPWNLRPSAEEYRLLLFAYERLGEHPDVIADIRDHWLAQPAPDPDIDQAGLIQLARYTREDRSMGGGIPIHGDLVHHTLRRGRMVSRKVHTFPATGPDFDRFIAGRDHPVAQLADCPCGSGRNILLCHRAGDVDKPCRCYSGALFKDCCLTPEAAVLLFREAAI